MLYVLLPICIVFALVLVWQGVPQNLNPYTTATTLEGATQTIAQGPVATQEIIKELGTNGGGFFNANSAHPYENPNAADQLPRDAGDLRHRRRASSTPSARWPATPARAGRSGRRWRSSSSLALASRSRSSRPAIRRSPQLGVDQQLSALQAGGNFEGKEVRFGMSASMLWTVITTDASCGAVNNMHDSLMPLAGLVPMLNMQLGEIIFGGVGAGLYGMLIFAILAVFIAGLMVGRTPEYLGKKIEGFEMKMAMLSVLILAALDPRLHRRWRA